ncbi:mucosa-associated lymphoid tissue lymphoma translocation protein 1 homolog [Penaeus japonicus]|uniref:mucosa-associated lymphoid tissue lymphoma translocation protein 1 homolog n=1 Tax=Penaeus japonicus TaxID=27405 RepID=UPI001C710F3D|nr:mucosa-associated lymphoid tissue lymphoma translocation protein 1 homolog [Penaeus japonicus]XP_042888503.1 mucosa-associated lymphoid tissue lymphoma translocation protein 1 homolog [Penaeus japonicus]XP_042888504.1 mucosa-associated lymphoid tissue lymphoma translocation protein 1 homolog [Penaeus japonicus]XP_042888505.1 mucosa-associated lymphoid tissue lymphoma translocation protein 1 homolog [Penaeus japonicus]XP_042888506.1 mucosa-associated lymphoid tissue lymphoma translocation pro
MEKPVKPKSFIHELPAKVYLDLERTLNDGYWEKMALICRNSLGKCVYSAEQLLEMEKSGSPGRKLLDSFKQHNMEVQVLQQLLRRLQLYSILENIITNVPVSVLKPREDIQESFEIGETVHLMIEAEGSPEPTFEWRYNGQPCAGATSRILEVPNFSPENEGEYVCHLTQHLGEDTIHVSSPKFHLSMKKALPKIEIDLEDISLECGEELMLSCKAVGWPEPSFKWYKDSHLLKGYTKSTLKITNVDLLVSGSYYCEISNEVGQRFSRVVTVKVTPPCFAPEEPKIIMQPQKKSSYGLDDRVNLAFEVTCRYNVDFQCFVNQNPITDDHLTVSKRGDYYLCNLHYILTSKEWTRENRKPFQFCFLAKSPGGVVMSSVVEIQVEINFEPKIFTARNKFALLICNSEYPENELRTPQFDAKMLAKELAMLQFHCFIYSNVTRSEFRSAVRLFSEYIQEGDYAVFYFAGHGFHNKGNDYVMPIDTSSKYVHQYGNLRLPPEKIPNMEDCLTSTWISNIIQESEPALLFSIYDTCRTLLRHWSSGPEMKDTFKIAKGNSYTLYSTSESYGTSEGFKSSLLMQQFVKLVRNKVPVPELVQQFREAFSLSRVETQIPKGEGDLNQRRSLTDPAKPDEVDKDGVLYEWELLASVGGVHRKELLLGDRKIEANVKCKHADIAKDVHKAPSDTTWIITNYIEIFIWFTQDDKPIDVCSIWKKGLTVDLHFNNGVKDTTFLKGKAIYCEIQDLQKLREPLKLELTLKYLPKGLKSEVQEFDLGWPSVSKQNEHWNCLD